MGMMFEEFGAEARAVEVNVYLGCGYRFMTEHFLDGAQVGSPFEQMSGK